MADRRIRGTTRLHLRELRDRTEVALENMLGHPVYIVFAHEAPSRFRSATYRAFTSQSLGSVLRPHLQERWRGWGAAMIVNERDLIDYARTLMRIRPGTRSRMIAGQEFLSTTCHEVAHAIQGDYTSTPEPTAEWTEALSGMTAALCVAGVPPITEIPVPWAQHDAGFLRTYLHTCHRLANAIGIRFGPGLDTKQYGLSSIWRWESALGDEPERLAALPLEEIRATPPPAAFAKLWRDDLKKWFLEIESASDFQVAAFVRGSRVFPFLEGDE